MDIQSREMDFGGKQNICMILKDHHSECLLVLKGRNTLYNKAIRNYLGHMGKINITNKGLI
jgi:hypothetical protein